MRTVALMAVWCALLCGCASGLDWKRQDFAFATPDDPPAASAETNTIALTRITISPLFQDRSFTYRTGDHAYEQDPYAGFLVPPERALAEPLRAGLEVFGHVLEPGSALSPALVAEVSVNELYGDFRKPDQPAGAMQLHLIVYKTDVEGPGRVVFDKVCSHETPMPRKTPDALMAAWDADLREILQQISSDYAKANSHDSGR